jgi:hypothetical protein
MLLCQFQVCLPEVSDEEALHTKLKQLSGNLLPLTLNLWPCALCCCKTLFAKPSSTPKNRLGLGAELTLVNFT